MRGFGRARYLYSPAAHYPLLALGFNLLCPELVQTLSLAPEQPLVRSISQELPGRPRPAAPAKDSDDFDAVARNRLHRLIRCIRIVGPNLPVHRHRGSDHSSGHDKDIPLEAGFLSG